jgi:hypothetical protein
VQPGIFPIFPIYAAPRPQIGMPDQWVGRQFPSQHKREFIRAEPGIKSAEPGITGTRREQRVQHRPVPKMNQKPNHLCISQMTKTSFKVE